MGHDPVKLSSAFEHQQHGSDGNLSGELSECPEASIASLNSGTDDNSRRRFDSPGNLTPSSGVSFSFGSYLYGTDA
jgi:hypothetical protein